MYLFLHIPKTAGTTFSSILKRNFKDKYIRIYGLKKIDFFSDEEMKSLAVFFPDAQCISAHKFVCPIPQPDDPNVRYELITFLRDPVERSLSHYFFQKKQVSLGVKKDFVELPFEQYFEKVKERGYQDSGGKWSYQCDMQSYVLDRNYDMEKAKRRMRKEFFFVGTSERFEESLVLLKKKFKDRGMDFRINYFAKNISKKRKPAKEVLRPEAYNKVLENNKLDKELHDYANQLLDEEIEKYGRDKFYRDLSVFKKKLKRFSLVAPLMIFLGKVFRRFNKKLNDWFGWL